MSNNTDSQDVKSYYNPDKNISDKTENTGQSLFVYIDEWDSSRLYTYMVILLIIIWFFSRNNVTIGFLVSLIVGYFVISYMNHHTKKLKNTQQDIVNIKEDSIKPKPKKETLQNTDIRDILFSIQDLRAYNPQSYEIMIKRMDDFFEYYNIVFTEPSRAYIYYDMMVQCKRDVLNNLSSIIFSLPEDSRVRAKLNRGVDALDESMTKYLDHISYVADEYLYVNGYNTDTKILNYGTKPHNQYDDMFQPYSFEVY